ncbi:SpoIIIAH-like family protein [Cohnella faecalis]|uniref:SpoIIIAH-like family protein n=1 Tax=Cohnella faecalis TaxID=2315694 RepID=A0A398CM56_9BACL|nr:SpoIIIAH-like family protein [Cohnella faecalis]RIE00731.1 hypothetical protein D3H35_26410 [Cohnella faecalis]
MNNKRQTIWLVSMLSLMVILSAYYLFTEDVSPSQNASGTKSQAEQTDATKTSGTTVDGVTVTEVDSQEGTESTGTTAGGESDGKAQGEASGAAATGDSTDASQKKDEAVIKKLGSEYFDKLQMEQNERFSKLHEQYLAVIADTKSNTPEEATMAAEESMRLEDLDARMTSLEDKLLLDYGNAVVTQDENNFSVVVEAEKLEKKQAVSIVSLALKELNVTPDRVTVQFVAPQ